MDTISEIAFIAAALTFAGCSTKPTEAQSALAPATTPAVAALARPGCTQNFTAFDANGDQRVSRQEFLERPHAHSDPEAVFASRDHDADGSLTSDEFCSGWRGARAAGPGRGPAGARMGKAGCTGPCAGPGMGMGRGPGMGMGVGPRCEARFGQFDANSDGNVSEAEFTALPHPLGDAKAIFAARDGNHDGQLTKTEFCAAWTPPRPVPSP